MTRRRRRANGEGTVCRRKDGSWLAGLTVGADENGKAIRRYVSGKTQAEVLERLDRLRADRAAGLMARPSHMRLGMFLRSWLENASPRLAPSTVDLYRRLIDGHVAPRVGGVFVHKLEPRQVQAMLSEMERGGLSPRMRQLCRGLLRTALQQAVRGGEIPRNPVDATDRPRAPRREIRPLAPDQVRALLAAASGDRLEALFVLAVTTGMRFGELLGLTWGDIDLEAGRIAVRRQLRVVGSKPELAELKTEKSRRRVELTGLAARALREHRGRLPASPLPSAPVFTSPEGAWVRANNLRRREFKRVLERAGLPRIRFHDLRHTAATLMLSEGVHPKVVQEALGHSQISITLDTYSHVLPTMQREAADRLDALLGG